MKGSRKAPVLLLKIDPIVRADALRVQDVLAGKKYETLEVVLQTGGGDVNAAFNITKLLRKHAASVNILVPLFAKSAGTLICLGGNKILMSEFAELGPLDAQLPEKQEGESQTYKSALDGFKALEEVRRHALETLDLGAKLLAERSGLKMSEVVSHAIDFAAGVAKPLYTQLNPTSIGQSSRALQVGERYGVQVLIRCLGWDEPKAERAVRTLVYDYPAHDFILDYEEMVRLGFPAEKINEADVLQGIGQLLLKTNDDVVMLLD